MAERTVHALMADGSRIERSEPGGVWYHADDESQYRIGINDAVKLATGGRCLDVNFGLPGGMRFDAKVRRAQAIRDATTAPPSPVQPPDDQRCPTCGRGGEEGHTAALRGLALAGDQVEFRFGRTTGWTTRPPLDPTVLEDAVWPGEDAE